MFIVSEISRFSLLQASCNLFSSSFIFCKRSIFSYYYYWLISSKSLSFSLALFSSSSRSSNNYLFLSFRFSFSFWRLSFSSFISLKWVLLFFIDSCSYPIKFYFSYTSEFSLGISSFFVFKSSTCSVSELFSVCISSILFSYYWLSFVSFSIISLFSYSFFSKLTSSF